ncbi:MAG: TolC family protein [Fibromonadaceae bacterium]|jgi:outer membrane protein TolC|nr:TolC family protein [Fibromonadaceae bacterium]
MKKNLGLFAFLLLLPASIAYSYELSLSECLHDGVKGSVALRKAELGTEKMDAQVSRALRSYLPQVTASGSVTRLFMDPTMVPNYKAIFTSLATAGAVPFDPNEAMLKYPINWNMAGDLKLTQFLYVPQVITGIKMAKKGKEIDALAKEATSDGIIQGLATLYWTIVYMEENLVVLTRSRDNLTRVQKVISDMVAHGIAKKSDFNSMGISIATLDAQIDQLEDQIDAQKKTLLTIMGRSPNDEITLKDRFSMENRVKQLSGSPKETVMLKLIQKQIELQDLQITLTGTERWPSIVAFASYGTQASREKFDFLSSPQDKFSDNGAVGINVTVPIFDGLSNSAAKTQARIERQQLELDAEQEKLNIDATAANAKAILSTAQSGVLRRVETVKMAEENYSMKEAEYQEQVAPLTDLITAESNVLQARSSLIDALYSEKKAELDLEAVLGMLHRRIE